MKKARLILGTTNSVPVGATDDEIEAIYQHSLRPYLRVLYKADTVPAVLHLSGHLLAWITRHHSEYTDVLSEMVQRRQVELLGGGYYDPVFPLIPRPDRIGQIEALTTLVRKRFRRRPRGACITRSVWAADLPGTLRSCGMEYVFLDDFHFLTAGCTGTNLSRPGIVEDQGKTVVAFPVCHDLLAASRSSQPAEVIRFLTERATHDETVVYSLIEDGRRYRETSGRSRAGEQRIAWLEQFLDLLARNREAIEVVLPYRHLREHPPRARVYFGSVESDSPAAELLKNRHANGLDVDATGGQILRCLTRYGESNLLYAKMQYTHVLVNQIRGDKYRKQAAREELWRGQSHSVYLPDGGIYNNRFRKKAYESLIEAEKTTRERGIFSPSVVVVDFDMDGLTEYLHQGQNLNAYVHREGGRLFELDYLPVSWNYCDTMSRRPEPYHTPSIAKRGYDGEMRHSFMDRFLDPKLTIERFIRGDYRDLGGFASTLYEQTEYKREGHKLGLIAEGQVVKPATAGRSGESTVPVTLEKRYTFGRSSVQVDYVIHNRGEKVLSSVFAPEFSLAFGSDAANALRMFLVGKRGAETEVSPAAGAHPCTGTVRMQDLVKGVTIALTTAGCEELWCVPLETVSQGPSGPESNYQGTCIVPRWKLDVKPGESTEITASLSLE